MTTPIPWILIGIAVLLALMPRWTRPDIYFSVTVPLAFPRSPEGRRILHHYLIEITLHAIVAIAIAAILSSWMPYTVLASVGWLMVGSSWAMIRARKAVSPFAVSPNPIREAQLTPNPETLPGGWAVALGPLMVLAATALYVTFNWDDLPTKLPVHWGLHGVDRWVDRTPRFVAGFLLQLACMCVTLLLCAYGIVFWSRRVSASGPRLLAESRFRRIILWQLIGLPYVIVIPVVVQFLRPDLPSFWYWPLLVLVAALGLLIYLTRLGQGGTRAPDVVYSTPVGDSTPDSAWKYGMFYYNPDDPAVFVEKRMGIGYTLNFARRWSWVVLVVTLAPILLLSLFRR